MGNGEGEFIELLAPFNGAPSAILQSCSGSPCGGLSATLFTEVEGITGLLGSTFTVVSVVFITGNVLSISGFGAEQALNIVTKENSIKRFFFIKIENLIISLGNASNLRMIIG
jgi:hypothetical protein